MDDHPGFDIEIANWPKRRSAMLYLLDNPKLPDYSRAWVRTLAFCLCDYLKNNGHPVCAYIILLRLSGVRAFMIDGKAVVIEQIMVEDVNDLANE